MTLQHCDGFDLGDALLRYAYSNGGNVNTGYATTAFGTGFAISLSGNGQTLVKSLPSLSQAFTGFRYRTSATSSANPFFNIYGDNGATTHLNLIWLTGTTLSLRRGTTVLATATVNDPVDWVFIEVSATIADSGGTCVVKIDGTEIINFTGDTKNGGTGTTIDAIGFMSANASNHYFDDWYICDSTGSAPHNTFLGPVRVFTKSASGAGSSTQMTPSTGANYQCTDEQPYSSADYVTGSSGQVDLYAIADIPATAGTIFAVCPTAVAKKTDAGLLDARNVVKSGATTQNGATSALSSSDGSYMDILTTDPNTGLAWTIAGVNAIEAGVEVL